MTRVKRETMERIREVTVSFPGDEQIISDIRPAVHDAGVSDAVTAFEFTFQYRDVPEVIGVDPGATMMVCEYCDMWCDDEPCDETGKVMAPHDQCSHWELVDYYDRELER